MIRSFPEPLKAVRQFWASVSFIRKLADKQGEWLGVPRDSQRAGVDGIETHVANQFRCQLFCLLVVAAVHETRPADLALASNTSNSTSLGTVLNAQTTRA